MEYLESRYVVTRRKRLLKVNQMFAGSGSRLDWPRDRISLHSFLSWWPAVPSCHRNAIQIGGETTVELDYSGLHPRLLYARVGVDPGGDLYDLPGCNDLTRRQRKRVVNTLVNARSPARARQSVRDHRRPHAVESIDVDRVLAAAWERHAPISQRFGSGEGLRLQNVDSEVCEHVVLTLTRAGIPVLPIHDGFRTRERDEGRLREAMRAGLVRMAGVRDPAGFLPDAS